MIIRTSHHPTRPPIQIMLTNSAQRPQNHSHSWPLSWKNQLGCPVPPDESESNIRTSPITMSPIGRIRCMRPILAEVFIVRCFDPRLGGDGIFTGNFSPGTVIDNEANNIRAPRLWWHCQMNVLERESCSSKHVIECVP